MGMFDRLLDKFKLESTREMERNFFSCNNDIQDIHHEKEQASIPLIKSQFSSMPRYYTINGVKYDIDNPADIERIPIFNKIIEIDGVKYGMDSILRKHGHECYIDNKSIYNASTEKEREFRSKGIYFQTEEEKQLELEYEQAKRERELEEKAKKELHDSFKIEDMRQFTEIPFEWHWVMELRHTNGIAWFMLNTNNQFIALSAINYINSILKESEEYTGWKRDYYISTENIDFFYPIPMKKNSLPNTYVECIPYTKTGKISKYPAILRFKEHSDTPVKYIKDMSINIVYGSICFMRDGNIGKADITINEFWIQIRLKGLTLNVQRIGKNTLRGNVDIYRKKL